MRIKKIIRYVENPSVRPSMRSLPNINGQTVCRILYITLSIKLEFRAQRVSGSRKIYKGAN